jgi:hypothetical protein
VRTHVHAVSCSPQGREECIEASWKPQCERASEAKHHTRGPRRASDSHSPGKPQSSGSHDERRVEPPAEASARIRITFVKMNVGSPKPGKGL